MRNVKGWLIKKSETEPAIKFLCFFFSKRKKAEIWGYAERKGMVDKKERDRTSHKVSLFLLFKTEKGRDMGLYGMQRDD